MLRSLQNISIVNRLTWLCSLSAFLVLSGLIYFLYNSFTGIIHKSNQQTVHDEMHYIKDVIIHHQDFLSRLDEEFSWLPSVIRQNNGSDKWVSPYDYLRIVNEQGQVLLETPGMAKIISKERFVQLIQGKEYKTIKLLLSNKQHHFLLMTKQVVRPQTHQHYLLQLVFDVTTLENIITSYRYLLMVAMIFAALITALLGRLIAQRAMSALFQLTKAAEKITIQGDKTSIKTRNWPPELRSLANVLNKTIGTIHHSYQKLSQFSANLAHELRTPINNLIGATEVALTQPRAIAEYQQLLTSNLEEFRRIANLIERLLFLARAESPKRIVQYSIIEVTDEFALSCEYFQVVAEERHISLSYSGTARLQADITLFRQALNNLIDNALKYTQPGGKVTLQAESNKQYVTIRIADTGIGVAQSDLAKVCERFYRGETAFNSRKGFGLGLAIVQSIVKIHHGDIVVQSQLDVGTVVTLTFPVMQTKN